MPIPRPENQIWFVFNRLPGGQLTAQHVEDIEKNKKVGDDTVRVSITSADQVASIKKQKEVAIYIVDPATGRGSLTKNEVIVYDGPGKEMLWKNPRAANVAIEWAIKKGARPIPVSKDSKGDDPKTYEYDKRIGALEGDVREVKDTLKQILEAVGSKKA